MLATKRKLIEDEIRREARAMVQRNVPVGEYSARIFGPDGLLRQLWKTRADRQSLLRSALYHDLRRWMDPLERTQRAEFEADVERLSGRLTVVVPKSLHAALRKEAIGEGISLSELIRLKLGLPYRLTTRCLASLPKESAAA